MRKKGDDGAFRSARRAKERLGWTDLELIEGIAAVIPLNKSILDLGAGQGRYVKALLKKGYDVDGVDGAYDVEVHTKGLIKHANLTKEIVNCGIYDWGLFLEVGEHIPPEKEEDLLRVITTISYTHSLIVSWATIGQKGRDHVNCHSSVYIASEFARREWFVDEDATTMLRSYLGKQNSYRGKVMVLRDETD